MNLEDKIKSELLNRGFDEYTILNNKGLIEATIDESMKYNGCENEIITADKMRELALNSTRMLDWLLSDIRDASSWGHKSLLVEHYMPSEIIINELEKRGFTVEAKDTTSPSKPLSGMMSMTIKWD